MRLYTWWRSQAAFRVRIALNLKGVDAEYEFVDLSKGEQTDASYRAVNPEMLLPTLIDDNGERLFQSLAIIEYLEEKFPYPPLLPDNRRARAFVRAIAQTIAADAHPLVVPRVRNYLTRELMLDDQSVMNWLRHWLDETTRVIEQHLVNYSRNGQFCCGDRPTIADICLVPHLTSAIMLYDCDLMPYPKAHRIYDACMELDAFANAYPTRQPDAAPL